MIKINYQKLHLLKKVNSAFLSILIFLAILIFLPHPVLSTESNSGEKIFNQYCVGCHINGGNIVKRNKTLKLSALERNGLDNPTAIAKVAREGIGRMSGYEKFLGNSDDKLVAEWIWIQAQKAWVQG